MSKLLAVLADDSSVNELLRRLSDLVPENVRSAWLQLQPDTRAYTTAAAALLMIYRSTRKENELAAVVYGFMGLGFLTLTVFLWFSK